MVQEIFKSLASGSCLALCIAKKIDVGATDGMLMNDVIKGWSKGFILDDGFVKNPTEYCKMLDTLKQDWTYEIKEISALSDVPRDEVLPVFYSIDGQTGHFVLVMNGKIIWNPLDKSRNVELGTPRSVRIVRAL